MMQRNTDTIVFHFKIDRFAVTVPTHSNVAFVRRILHGIKHQIGKGTAELFFAAAQPKRIVALQRDVMLALTAERTCVFH